MSQLRRLLAASMIVAAALTSPVSAEEDHPEICEWLPEACVPGVNYCHATGDLAQERDWVLPLNPGLPVPVYHLTIWFLGTCDGGDHIVCLATLSTPNQNLVEPDTEFGTDGVCGNPGKYKGWVGYGVPLKYEVQVNGAGLVGTMSCVYVAGYDGRVCDDPPDMKSQVS